MKLLNSFRNASSGNGNPNELHLEKQTTLEGVNLLLFFCESLT